jgi:site-specific recombinase XerD
MKLLLQFAAVRCRRSVDQLVIEDLTAPMVLDFLADLETSRGNTIRTRNSRLAAVQTFFRYVAGREPALAATCSPVLSIPAKKALRPLLGYLSEQELGHLLAQIDRLATRGERDYVLLSILYDTGARIQELLDLTPRDFHLESPPFVRVRGKGRRERLCPLLPQSARLVRQFLSAAGRQLDDQQPFLQNGRGGRLGRHGARYILLKYLRRATPAMQALARVGISPHTLRHTKAMHLLQSGVSPRHGQRLPWTCGYEVHRSLRSGGPRDETQGSRLGKRPTTDASTDAPSVVEPHRVARSSVAHYVTDAAEISAKKLGLRRFLP